MFEPVRSHWWAFNFVEWPVHLTVVVTHISLVVWGSGRTTSVLAALENLLFYQDADIILPISERP